MNFNKHFKKEMKKENYFTPLKHKCKCGHTIMIPAFIDKILCNWCGHYVYRDEQSEFKEKLKQKINNIK